MKQERRKKTASSTEGIRWARRCAAVILLFGMLFFTLLCTVGCFKAVSDPTSFLSHPLDAELTVNTGDLVYSVTVHLGATSDNGLRDCEIVFLSPASLSGMTARENADGRFLFFSEKTVALKGNGQELFLASELLSPGETVSTATSAENGREKTVVRFSDGRELSFDAESGTLLSVKGEGVSASVTWIEERKGAEAE